MAEVSKDRIRSDLEALMRIPGLCGHEGRVRRAIAASLADIGLTTRTDRLGNLIATIDGTEGAPSVMLFTHMDQLGFIVRRIEPDGFVRVERVGGVPEKALPSQAVVFCVGDGKDRAGVIANKSHHATAPDEKYRVLPYQGLYIDTGLDSADAVRDAGIDIGTPVVYRPNVIDLGNDRIAGAAVDDRAGCAVLLVSVELDEIMSLSDRILVMFEGGVVGEVAAEEADSRTLGLMMANIVPDQEAGAGHG